MSIIEWKKPVTIEADDEHALASLAHMLRTGKSASPWHGQVKTKDDVTFVVLRKTTTNSQLHSMANILVYVAIDGYHHDHRETVDRTKSVNVKMSANGGITLTFDDMKEMQLAIEEAKFVLLTLKKKATQPTTLGAE